MTVDHCQSCCAYTVVYDWHITFIENDSKIMRLCVDCKPVVDGREVIKIEAID
jgi:hypothetical protein